MKSSDYLADCRCLNGNAGHVLIVEDNVDDIDALRRLFREVGLASEVRTAVSVKEAQKLLTVNGIHWRVAFIDWFLGPENADVLLAWMNERPALQHTVKVVGSSSEHVGFIREVYRTGADSYITKPFRAADLLNLCQHFQLTHKNEVS